MSLIEVKAIVVKSEFYLEIGDLINQTINQSSINFQNRIFIWIDFIDFAELMNA